MALVLCAFKYLLDQIHSAKMVLQFVGAIRMLHIYYPRPNVENTVLLQNFTATFGFVNLVEKFNCERTEA